VNGIDWAHAWPYVTTGYLLAAGLIGGYATWVIRKLRRAERSFETSDEGSA
jgi:hypothetical protein